MSDRLLLDTHVALWLDSGDEKLHASTRSDIDACWRAGGTILFSAVSAWEIAILVDKGQIELDAPVDHWIGRFLGQPGVDPVALDHWTAARAYQIHEFDHRDPADRLLIASAIGLGCPLVTYDDRIRQFGEMHGQRYGFEART